GGNGEVEVRGPRGSSTGVFVAACVWPCADGGLSTGAFRGVSWTYAGRSTPRNKDHNISVVMVRGRAALCSRPSSVASGPAEVVIRWFRAGVAEVWCSFMPSPADDEQEIRDLIEAFATAVASGRPEEMAALMCDDEAEPFLDNINVNDDSRPA